MKLLYFSAPWCGPCKMLGPIMERVAQTIPVEKVLVDDDPELASKYAVRSIPTVIVVDENGVELERTLGNKPETFYHELFEKHQA